MRGTFTPMCAGVNMTGAPGVCWPLCILRSRLLQQSQPATDAGVGILAALWYFPVVVHVGSTGQTGWETCRGVFVTGHALANDRFYPCSLKAGSGLWRTTRTGITPYYGVRHPTLASQKPWQE